MCDVDSGDDQNEEVEWIETMSTVRETIYAMRAQTPPDIDHLQLPPADEWRYKKVARSSRWKRLRTEGVDRWMLLPEEVLPRWSALVKAKDGPVLIVGPRGTGKDVLAKLISADDASPRKGRPRPSPVNCPAMGELLAGELFGYERGAFTTGVERRPGILQEAKGGTVILDEIAEIVLEDQAMLLTVLQEKVIRPLSGKPIEVDVRIIATANRDPDDERFLRQDLRDRFGLPLRLIGLCDKRPAEVCMLLWANLGMNTLFDGVSVRWLLMLMWHSWPGNARELSKYCEAVSDLTEFSDDGEIQGRRILDARISSESGLEAIPARDEEGHATSEDPIRIARGLLQACWSSPLGFGNVQPARLREIANSLKLLAYLAADAPPSGSPLCHPDAVPLRRLEQPDCFPCCYDVLLGHSDYDCGHCLNLIEFLSAIVRISRLAGKACDDARCEESSKAFDEECDKVFGLRINPRAPPPDDKWLAWIAGLPHSCPDYVKIDTTEEDDSAGTGTSSSPLESAGGTPLAAARPADPVGPTSPEPRPAMDEWPVLKKLLEDAASEGSEGWSWQELRDRLPERHRDLRKFKKHVRGRLGEVPDDYRLSPKAIKYVVDLAEENPNQVEVTPRSP